MKRKSFVSMALAMLCAIQGFAWSAKGHDVVTCIAERHLTPAAKAHIDSVLDGKSIIYWANWLDNASHTPQYAYSKTWHYKNIDYAEQYDKASKNPNGDVLTAIEEQVKKLQSGKLTKEEEALALKILVHVVGDLHQPMHMGHKSDLGGNKVTVKHFGRDTNLHSLWDGALVEGAHKWSYSEWADQIDRVTKEQEAEIVSGNPFEWGRETYTIACEVYQRTAIGANISYDEIAFWAPTIEQQLLKGGLRLASILNSIYK